MRDFKRFIDYMGKYKFAYWSLLIITVIVGAVTDIVYSYVNKLLFNSVEYADRDKFVVACVLCVIMLAIYCVFPYLRLFLMKVVRKLTFDIKIAMFDKLMKMDMTYYETHHSAEALKTLNWDANSLKDGYFSHVYWVLDKIVAGVVSIIAMLIYSPILALISIAFSIITVKISVSVNKKIKALDKEIQHRIANLSKRLSDILTGFTLLKMFGGGRIVIDKYRQESDSVAKAEIGRYNKVACAEVIAFLVGILGNFGTIIAGAFLVAHGKLDYGTVMAVVSLQMRVSSMVQRFGNSITTLNSTLVKASRVFDFLELKCVEADKRINEEQNNHSEMPFVMKNVKFSYNGEDVVIDNFNLELNQGEKILIMGESGCGKSTILKMLLRFYEKDSGEIKLFGKSIDDYSFEQLRDMITYVPQNSYLFEGSIKENIAFGSKAEVSYEDIVKASKMAYADEFIKDLPQGYDTVLSAGGTNLSGGQRQRIAIARAFLKDSPILLLDEPSSALDVRSEKMINEAMKQLMENRIVLMVTHRMTSFDTFDRVIKIV